MKRGKKKKTLRDHLPDWREFLATSSWFLATPVFTIWQDSSILFAPFTSGYSPALRLMSDLRGEDLTTSGLTVRFVLKIWGVLCINEKKKLVEGRLESIGVKNFFWRKIDSSVPPFFLLCPQMALPRLLIHCTLFLLLWLHGSSGVHVQVRRKYFGVFLILS